MAEIRIAINGAAGRMGQSLVRAITETADVQLVAAFEHEGSDQIGVDVGRLAGSDANGVTITSEIEPILDKVDVIIDFSTPDSSCALAQLAAEKRVAIVVGTTGFNEDQNAFFAELGDKCAIVKSGNMSLGVNLLAVLVEQAAKALPATDFDIEVLEMHHRHKVDAPSGTAFLLGDAAARGRNVELSGQSVRVRDGQTGPRKSGTIGFATLRGGSVVGDHSVILAGSGERIELSHYAQDRSLFAAGALKAGIWAANQSAGLYSMRDVLGL